MHYIGQLATTKAYIHHTLSDNRLDTTLAILGYQIPIAKQQAKQRQSTKCSATDYPVVDIIELTDIQVNHARQNATIFKQLWID